MRLVDVHCHLTSYKDDLPDIIKRIDTSMDLAVTSGITPEDNLKSLDIASRSSKIQVTFGLNPVSLGKDPKLFDRYISVLYENVDSVSGIGEVGIDYYWEKDESRRERQRQFFVKFIALANDLGKPLVIHTRSAMADTLDILERHTPDKFFIHSFRGSVLQAKRVIDIDGFISLSTAMVRFPGDYTKLINAVPLEYILTETDSPYLSPVKGETNYPWNVKESLRMIANVLGQDVGGVGGVILENARKLFG